MKKNLLSTMFDDLSLFTIKESTKLKTDIKEYSDHYLFEIDVAGHDKNDIDIRIEDNYMTVEVKNTSSFEETSEKENYNYIRKERFLGSTSRTYYVGEVIEKDIKANFNNGLLLINVPKEKDCNTCGTKIKID
jgi:HSP20 family molecular chaperone IbpA